MNTWYKSLVFAIILAIIFSWFALSNSQIVLVSLLFWKSQISLSLVILISILVGVILTGFIALAEQTRLLGKIGELEKKLKYDEGLLKTEKKAE